MRSWSWDGGVLKWMCIECRLFNPWNAGSMTGRRNKLLFLRKPRKLWLLILSCIPPIANLRWRRCLVMATRRLCISVVKREMWSGLTLITRLYIHLSFNIGVEVWTSFIASFNSSNIGGTGNYPETWQSAVEHGNGTGIKAESQDCTKRHSHDYGHDRPRHGRLAKRHRGGGHHWLDLTEFYSFILF